MKRPRAPRNRALVLRSAAPILIGAALALAGCPSERGARYRCTCPFLTDFDDASEVLVEVCAPAPDRAPGVGQGCAQSGAPAPISSCSCSAIADSEACSSGECKLLSR